MELRRLNGPGLSLTFLKRRMPKKCRNQGSPKTEMSKPDQQLLEHSVFLGSWADGRDEMRLALSALAERFVIEHRRSIEKLALALDQRRTMSGAEVGEIIRSIGQ
ncbi:hypothetical protein [Rhizobium leguminosarum]|uniref:hypothetical protein n=2 Tax=Rhizobium/Agrobacterium group TaxID=227290 RepID=UPI001039E763|nr:hypothetical protein [Rhizobium leguminosarum]TBZ28853.1 hypothetical protein E0H44_36910 [Rhizobium leguminosarum bv. viciae]